MDAARPGMIDPQVLLRDGLLPRPQRPAVVSARAVDGWLLGAVLALLVLGLLMVYDASYFVVHERYRGGITRPTPDQNRR